jgi:hypothetical protein
MSARERPTATPAAKTAPAAQLKGFIAKVDRQNQLLIRAVRRSLRRRLPTATELVYDNYNFFVIGYSPTERPSDAVLSAAGANGVGLCFIRGARLRDLAAAPAARGPAAVLNEFRRTRVRAG